jgi:FdhE protein
MYEHNLNEVLKRLDALTGYEHVSADYVRFRGNLLKAQVQARDGATSSRATTPAAREGFPLLNADAVSLDGAQLLSFLDKVRVAAAERGQQSVELARIHEAAQKEAGLLEQLARKTAFGPDERYLQALGERLEVSLDALAFIGRVLAAPFVTACAEHIRPQASRSFQEERSASGHCPVCGSPPGLARLVGEEGRRVLCCSLCGQQWAFARRACPYCGNKDQQSLGVLVVEDQEDRRIEVCDACKGYIKTIDERRLPAGEEVIPLVEETATLHLDLLAEKEGYLRKLPYVALR